MSLKNASVMLIYYFLSRQLFVLFISGYVYLKSRAITGYKSKFNSYHFENTHVVKRATHHNKIHLKLTTNAGQSVMGTGCFGHEGCTFSSVTVRPTGHISRIVVHTKTPCCHHADTTNRNICKFTPVKY